MGGKAFQGTTRIKRENVKPTLEHFLDDMLWPCGVHNYKMIGSTGKASLSGDLDIVIPVPEGRSASAFKSYLLMMFQEMVGSDRARSLGQILTVKYPIMIRPGVPSGEYVQVDLMLSDDLDGVVCDRLVVDHDPPTTTSMSCSRGGAGRSSGLPDLFFFFRSSLRVCSKKQV